MKDKFKNRMSCVQEKFELEDEEDGTPVRVKKQSIPTIMVTRQRTVTN